MPDYSQAARSEMSTIRSKEKEKAGKRIMNFGGAAAAGGVVSVAFDQRFSATKIGNIDIRYILAVLGLMFAPKGEKGDIVRGFSLGLVLPEVFQEGAQIVRRTGLPNAMSAPALGNGSSGPGQTAGNGGTGTPRPYGAGGAGTPSQTGAPVGMSPGGAPGV